MALFSFVSLSENDPARFRQVSQHKACAVEKWIPMMLTHCVAPGTSQHRPSGDSNGPILTQLQHMISNIRDVSLYPWRTPSFVFISIERLPNFEVPHMLGHVGIIETLRALACVRYY